jgi:carbamoyltransferase
MGLAPYGEPKYVKQILDEVVDLKDDGSLVLNQKYFNYLGGLTMTNGEFDRLFGAPPRVPETNLVQRDLDLACSVQEVCEEAMLRMARTTHQQTGLDRLCLAGGVALNCVGNGRILREGPFKQIWIQPASGDAGGALGVAQLIWHRHCQGPRSAGPRDAMRGAYLGPDFTPDQIKTFLDGVGAKYHRADREELIERAAGILAEGCVVGWFSGRMEFGPRALGARSILGDPRNPQMQSQMNIKIKFREGFRPFAPSVLRERVADWFELDADSPYMLLVAPVKQERRLPTTDEEESRWGIEKLKVRRSEIPAVTHVDYSARVQTVDRQDNAEYYDLIKAFEQRTGCPVLVNTSFNVRGEPIVCTPEDAYRCFMRTNIDYLVLWPYLLAKTEQPAWREEGDWRQAVPLD